MTVSRASLQLAVHNVAKHGDTDVFPYPLENHWFHDAPDAIVGLLEELDQNFDAWLVGYPIVASRLLAGVGYAGFRAATQIHPIWNAYLLALVLDIAPDIEAARLPVDKEIVFSYRFRPDLNNSTLFDADLGWNAYQKRALVLAGQHEVVIVTDIADFYPRIYHHRLENALNQATSKTEVVRRVMLILSALSGGTSYGLPVGGHAARLLAELLLNRTDRLLRTNSIQFVRFVDDYVLFAANRENAQAALVELSGALLVNEGFSLSRAKTRFMSGGEFSRLSPAAEPVVGDSIEEVEARSFLRLRLRYDPYSATAVDDYAALSAELRKFDITKMLAKELRKTRVDEALMRHLVKSLRYMEATVRDDALLSLLQNLEKLYPVFPTVAILLKALLPDMSPAVRDATFDTMREMIRRRSHITLVPTNLAYAVRIIAHDRSEETDSILISLYSDPTSDMLLRRDLLLAIARRRLDYWLSGAVKRFAIVTPWEKRALIAGSFILGDEGRHWRQNAKKQLSTPDAEFMVWVGNRNSGTRWEVPL
jgi:hypothetical protein